ncbi:GNAT family N-acetyltransferase [Halobacillus salinus]|uniref:GNAT family N-acetyltransferase n=1 Tax=Halobacillus salinus TaxID=192814 RepID=A0A4Z0GVQ5_9BACI|nr:GNAT family N-acetyltransferase [Halobacillus salinus]TGB00765.1 GNAT family N-acetyltransferase [Halobacillus salinus]
MEIKIDDLTGPEVAELLNQHIQSMRAHSPPESKHALDLDGLRKPDITFWSGWETGELVGCVAILELDRKHGEIKSMKTHPDHLRKGIAKQLLDFIIEEARGRGYSRLSLETGAMEIFQPARKLYENSGFEYCEPFSDYKKDPNSVFMRREL